MENGPGLKMYFLLKMVMFQCYLSLPGTIKEMHQMENHLVLNRSHAVQLPEFFHGPATQSSPRGLVH